MKITVLIIAILIAGIPFIGSSQTYSLPTDRSVIWQGNVGVSGDIPARTTIFTTLNPSGGNDASAIQTAINNCPAGQVVKLAAGTFNVSSSITVKSDITLRGTGMGATTIKGTAGMSGNCVVGIGGGYSLDTSVDISAGLGKDSTNITTLTAHGWNVGDIILIDQLNNPSDDPPVTNVGGSGTCTWCGRTQGSRALGQLIKISSVPTATTATLEIPLYWNYDASLSPQGTKLGSIRKDAGIEDLSVDNSVSGNKNQAGSGGTIVLSGTSNCWLLNVEGIYLWETMMRIRGVYRNTIRNCKFHEVNVPGSSKYGMWLNPYSSANLIENNQIYNVGSGVMLNGATSGNVIAYNYIANLHDPTAANWNKSAFAFHGGHPIMNLLEGNYIQGRFTVDNVWGSSSHNTFFRNRTMLTPDKTGAPWNFDFQVNSRYYNVVGNVAGTVGVETVYELNNVTLSGQAATYRLGYVSDGDGNPSGNDSQVAATLLRHGNWDNYNKTTFWNGSDAHILPNSLYLTSKPSWWGGCSWPAIGPDLTPMYPTAGIVGEGTPWNKTLETGIQEPFLNKGQNPDFIISPNPFNPMTNITFTLPEANQVKVSIFDLNGGCVRNLVNEKLNSGMHTTTWDAKASNGQMVSSGVYVVRMETGKTVRNKKICFVR